MMSETTFLVQLRRIMGRRLLRGPTGFFGFGNAMSVPLPRESSVRCCSNIILLTLDRYIEIDSDAYFNNSLLMLSGPSARPFLRECSAASVSDAVIGVFRGHGFPVKDSSWS